MHIRNRISDIKKIRCNACQDYLKMVAVEDWKNQLYEKTQIAVKYSPAKYKPAYKIMRTRGIENYEIDDMDVTFISEVIHKCSYIFPSKVETRKAIEQLTEDRNVITLLGDYIFSCRYDQRNIQHLPRILLGISYTCMQ